MTSRVTAGVRRSSLIAGLATLAGCGGSDVAASTNAIRASRTPAAVTAPSAAAEIQALRAQGWTTDFSKHAVTLTEFQDGGPPRDGIPPIDHPRLAAFLPRARLLAVGSGS